MINARMVAWKGVKEEVGQFQKDFRVPGRNLRPMTPIMPFRPSSPGVLLAEWLKHQTSATED